MFDKLPSILIILLIFGLGFMSGIITLGLTTVWPDVRVQQSCKLDPQWEHRFECVEQLVKERNRRIN